jgi:protein TonB
MFETTAVESRKTPFRKQPLLTLPLSIALHGAAVAGLLFAGTWSVDMPENAPAQIASFVVRVPAPTIPPGGGTPKPAASRPAPPKSQASPSIAPVEPQTAPAEIPDEVPQLEPGDGPVGDATGPDFGSGDPGAGSGNGTGWGVGDGTGDGIGDGSGTTPLRVGGSVMAPVVLRRVEPRYPQLLVKLKTRGAAVVECIVDGNGQVESVRVVSATHDLFGQAAAEAVKQWRFRAGTLNGKAVKTIFQLRVTFELTR